MIKFIFLFLVFFLGCSAQTDQINPESLDKKLDELIDVLHLNDQLPLLKEQMFNQKKQIDLYFNNSADSAVTQVLEDAIDKIITPEYINQNIREVYKITFTYEEISGMVDFYKSSVGQKVMKKTPELLKNTTNHLLLNFESHMKEYLINAFHLSNKNRLDSLIKSSSSEAVIDIAKALNFYNLKFKAYHVLNLHLEFHPDSLQTLYFLSALYSENGIHTMAVQVIENKLFNTKNKSIKNDLKFYLSYQLFKLQDWDRIISISDELLNDSTYNDKYIVHYNLACVYSQSNDLKSALFHFKKALDLIPQNSKKSQYEHILKDVDLDPLRKSEEFMQILTKLKNSI